MVYFLLAISQIKIRYDEEDMLNITDTYQRN